MSQQHLTISTFSIIILMLLVLLSTIQPIVAVICSVLFLILIILFMKNCDFSKLSSNIIIFTLMMITSFNRSDKIGALIVGMLLFIYIFNFLINKEYRKNSNSKLFLFFIVWVIYASFQMIFVEHTSRTWGHFQTLILSIAIIWLLLRLIDSKEKLDKLYTLWGFATLFSIFFGWWEVITNNHLPGSIGNLGLYNVSNIATVRFTNPNDYSFFLAISLPIMLLWINRSFKYKILGIFMVISSFYFVYMNDTRSIIMIYCISILFFVFFSKKKRNKLFFVLTIIALGFYFKDVIQSAISDMLTLGKSDDSSIFRQYLTESAWGVFKSNPLGVGSGNAESHMPVKGNMIHNFWFEILANYGLLVFIGLVLFFSYGIVKMYKSRNGELKNVIRPALGSTLIFIPTCVVSSSVFQFNITWVVFALIICVVNMIAKHNKQNLAQRNHKTNVQQEQITNP